MTQPSPDNERHTLQQCSCIPHPVFLGAGRDFHNFQVLYRDCEACYEVVGFSATQIPHISNRHFPAELAGKRYAKGLPIWPEEELEAVIKEQRVDRCNLA